MLDAMWAETARGLGGSLHGSSNGVLYDDFEGMWEALGPAWGEAPSHLSWLAAHVRGRPILGKMTERRYRARRSDRWVTEQWTYAVTPIDPPLFLGLDVTAQGGAIASFLSPKPDCIVGHPPFDAAFAVSAFSVPRVRELLDPRTATPLLDALTGYARSGVEVQISDRVARIVRSGLHAHHGILPHWCDAVTRVADEIALLRSRMPEILGELPSAGYEAVAGTFGLVFDRPRMRATGKVRAAQVRLSLEVRAKQVRTELRIEFPTSLGMNLWLARQGGLNFETELSRALFGGEEDIHVGDPAFDGSFVVRGQPVDRVRALFANPETRGRLWQLLQQTGREGNVTLDDRHLTIEVPRVLAHPAELGSLLEQGVGAFESLWPHLRPT